MAETPQENLSKEQLEERLNDLIANFSEKFEEARKLRLFVSKAGYHKEENSSKTLMTHGSGMLRDNTYARALFTKLTREETEALAYKVSDWSIGSAVLYKYKDPVENYGNWIVNGEEAMKNLIKNYEEKLIPEYKEQIRILTPLKEKLIDYWGEEVVNKISQTIEEKK